MGPPGLNFSEAWPRRITKMIDGVEINYVSRDDLIILKQAAGRERDLRDIDALHHAARLDTERAEQTDH